jgi:hypothetical protein
MQKINLLILLIYLFFPSLGKSQNTVKQYSTEYFMVNPSTNTPNTANTPNNNSSTSPSLSNETIVIGGAAGILYYGGKALLEYLGSGSSESNNSAPSNNTSPSTVLPYTILSVSNATVDAKETQLSHFLIYPQSGFNCSVKNLSISVISQRSGKVVKTKQVQEVNEFTGIDIYPLESDLPVTINISYYERCGTWSDQSVSASILLNKFCTIKVHAK